LTLQKILNITLKLFKQIEIRKSIYQN